MWLLAPPFRPGVGGKGRGVWGWKRGSRLPRQILRTKPLPHGSQPTGRYTINSNLRNIHEGYSQKYRQYGVTWH
jgi:hypothetical protein